MEPSSTAELPKVGNWCEGLPLLLLHCKLQLLVSFALHLRIFKQTNDSQTFKQNSVNIAG